MHSQLASDAVLECSTVALHCDTMVVWGAAPLRAERILSCVTQCHWRFPTTGVWPHRKELVQVHGDDRFGSRLEEMKSHRAMARPTVPRAFPRGAAWQSDPQGAAMRVNAAGCYAQIALCARTSFETCTVTPSHHYRANRAAIPRSTRMMAQASGSRAKWFSSHVWRK